ncbi:MAG: hypothetical protein RML84_10510 [Anaerolineae bacterium]|nr:hypothetical protein [Anaerolineae bacterium]
MQEAHTHGQRAAARHVLRLASEAFPLLASVALFLSIALRQLDLPGFYYDEALDLTPMLELMRGEAPELLRGIGAGRYPVMLLDYMGSLGGYLTVPFFWVFGVGYVAARAQPIFFACMTILLSGWLARRWFGSAVAAVTVLLLAAQPSFIWFSRQGISVTSVMTVFSVGGALLLDQALRDADVRPQRARAAALAAGLSLGLGLWAKFLFLRWIVALAAMGMVVGAFTGWARAGALKRLLPWVMLGFGVGAAPLLYYNVVGLLRDGQPWTLTLLAQSLTQPTQQFGVNNLDVLNNLRKAIEDVRVFVDGSYFWYNGVPFSNVYAVPTLLLACAVGSVLAWQRAAEERGRFFALLAGLAAITLQGAFTVSGLWSTHHFILLPLPQLAVACAAVWLAQAIAARLPASPPLRVGAVVTIVVALLIVPFSRDLWVSEQHHATLARTGGSGRFSDAVYKLARWLDENRIARPIALDWGIERNVRVLTADRVRPVEIFGFTPEADEGFRQRALSALQNPEHYYIVLWERFAVYNRRQPFTELAHRLGLEVVEVFIAHERSGLPVYVVLQARPKSKTNPASE